MNTTKIFSVIDKNYAPYVSVLIQNIKALASKNKKYEYIVVHKNIDDKTKFKLENLSTDNFKVKTLNIADYLDKVNLLFPANNLGDGTFYKLFAQDIFPEYDKILYLDVDLTVFEDIANLYEIDIEKYELAAGYDITIVNYNMNEKLRNNVAYSWHFNYYSKDLSMLNLDKYFNSGIMLMNLKLMREHNTLNNILELFKKRSIYRYREQDLLNKYYDDKYEKIKFLDLSYNFLNEYFPYQNELSAELFDKYKQAKKNIKIRHYVTCHKPWNDLKCPNLIHWWKYGIRQPNLLLNLFKLSIFRKLKLALLMLKCR